MPRTFYINPTRILGECWLPKPPVSSLKVRPSPFSRRPEMGIHLDLYVLLDQWPPIIYYLLCKWIWNAMAIHFYLSVPAFFMCQKKCVTATHLQSYKAKLNTLWPLQGKRRRGRLWRLPTCKKKKIKKIALQAWGYDFNSQSLDRKTWIWWHMFIIPTLGRQKQVNSWSLLAYQPSILDGL